MQRRYYRAGWCGGGGTDEHPRDGNICTGTGKIVMADVHAPVQRTPKFYKYTRFLVLYFTGIDVPSGAWYREEAA